MTYEYDYRYHRGNTDVCCNNYKCFIEAKEKAQAYSHEQLKTPDRYYPHENTETDRDRLQRVGLMCVEQMFANDLPEVFFLMLR